MVRENDLTDTIRKPIEKIEAQKVMAHIGEFHEAVNDSWKVRANTQQRKLEDGDPFALAEVYKTLSQRKKADTLSGADRRQLSQSEQCLSEELAMALDQSMDKVCQQMAKAALD